MIVWNDLNEKKPEKSGSYVVTLATKIYDSVDKFVGVTTYDAERDWWGGTYNKSELYKKEVIAWSEMNPF